MGPGLRRDDGEEATPVRNRFYKLCRDKGYPNQVSHSDALLALRLPPVLV